MSLQKKQLQGEKANKMNNYQQSLIIWHFLQMQDTTLKGISNV